MIQSPCVVTVDRGVQLTSDQLGSVDGLRGAKAGPDTVIDAATACLLSPQGNATLDANARITATDATIEGGGKKVVVGSSAILDVSGTLVLDAAGGGAIIGRSAQMTTGGDMELTAVNAVKIVAKAVIDAGGNLDMDAAAGVNKCKISGSATITFTTKSGNCAPRLP